MLAMTVRHALHALQCSIHYYATRCSVHMRYGKRTLKVQTGLQLVPRFLATLSCQQLFFFFSLPFQPIRMDSDFEPDFYQGECNVYHRRLPDLGDYSVCGFFT
jgi:hypothetical protein